MSPNVTALLNLLAKGPASRSDIEQALAPFAMSSQGVIMLLAGLIGRGRVESSQGLYMLSDRGPSSGAFGYARVVNVWLTLADGAWHPVDELFGSGGARHELFDRLIASGMCELFDNKVRVMESSASTFQAVWADERVFCKYADHPSAHADAVNRLLSEQLSLADRAELVCSAALSIGLNNVARRIGIGFNQATNLTKLNKLPSSVKPLVRTPSEANVLSKMANEQEMLEALRGHAAEPEDDLEEPPNVHEMAAATLKLAAATFELAASTERKITWIAKELGWKE